MCPYFLHKILNFWKHSPSFFYWEVDRYAYLTLFVGSLNFISLPSLMIVSAMVSEICKLNQNKKKKENSEIDYFQFKALLSI